MRLLYIIVFLSIYTFGFGQSEEPVYKSMMYDFSYNFYDVVESAENYFDSIDKTKKGSGWKPYQRWKEANEYKYYPTGDRSNVDPAFVQNQFSNFVSKNPQNNKALFNNWNDLGPYSIDSITGHYAAGIGRIEDFYVNPNNPNIIYQGSRSGGFWASSDGGTNWNGGSTDFLPGSGVNTIAVSPTNPDSILINVQNANNNTSYGLYRSVDGGITWNESNFNPTTAGYGGLGTNFRIYKVVYHPTIHNLIFIGTSQGIFRSDDNLATWTQLISGGDINRIEFHPTQKSTVYLYDSYYWANTHDQIYISTDGGLSYNLSGTIPNNNGNRNVIISTSPDCPNCVYVASSNGVSKSTDTGSTFSFLSNPDESGLAFAVSDLDTSNMIYGYVDLEASTDGGNTFNQMTYWSLGNTNGAGSGHQTSYNTSTNYIHADLRNARCINGVFYVSTDGFISKSSDNGVTWVNIGEGVGTRENYKIGVSQSNHYRTIAGSQDNGTSIKVKDHWIEFYGADGMEGLIHPLNDDWMLMSFQNAGRRITKDGGQNSNGASPSGAPSGSWIAPIAMDPNDHMTIYDFRDKVYKSEDFTDNYVTLGSPASFTGNINLAEIAENNSDIIVIAQGQYIDKSTDGGTTFTSIKNNLPNHSISNIAFDPQDDNTIIVTYARYQADGEKVFISSNGGNSWNNITHNLGSMPIRSVVIEDTDVSTIYLGAEVGVYSMSMNGNNWTLHNLELPNVAVRELEIMQGTNTLRAATWGRGLWEYSLVGRNNYPAIVYTDMTDTPAESTPKENVDQFINAAISYDGTLSSVYVSWSENTPIFTNTIAMTNVSDSTWLANEAIPNFPAGTKMFFKVVAVGSSQDTTETYKFMYKVQPFEFCSALGSTNNGNLYISSLTLGDFTNTTTNDTYTLYDNLIELNADEMYTITANANTGWSSNDFGAWIDYNNDRDFSSEENILFSPNSGSSATNSFNIPASALSNDTLRMRVRLSYWDSSPSPCGETLGEVEDYLIIIRNETCRTVRNLLDSGTGSLRNAISCSSPGDTIIFDPSLNGQTIEINSTAIILNKNLVISSNTSDNITIASINPQVASLTSLFEIQAGNMVEFIGLSFEGAYGLEGSVFQNSGQLILNNVQAKNGGKTDINSTVVNLSGGNLQMVGTTTVE